MKARFQRYAPPSRPIGPRRYRSDAKGESFLVALACGMFAALAVPFMVAALALSVMPSREASAILAAILG